MNVVMIGAGNVGTALSILLYQHQFNIIQVFSRTISRAEKLAKLVDADASSDLLEISPKAQLYILAVKDDSIERVAKKIAHLIPKKAIAVHTSGSMGLDVFDKKFSLNGCFYPLQTFKNVTEKDWKTIPIFITGSNNDVANDLQDMAKKLGLTSTIITDKERGEIHIAAVIVNNLVNQLYCQTASYLDNKKHFDLLKPLILKTVENAFVTSPCDVQTGPAKRGDKKVIKKHLKSLKKTPALRSIYKVISDTIQS